MNAADSKSINLCKWTDVPRKAPRRRPRAAPGALLVMLGGALVSSCIVIPVDYHATGSRHNLTAESTNLLQNSATTREEILLALGEPDFISEDGRRFGYQWTKVKAIWAVVSYGPGGGGEITRSYLIQTSFGENNRLSDVRFLKQWGDTVVGTAATNGRQ